MPVEKRTNAATIRAVLVLVFAMVGLVALVFTILGQGDGGGVEINLGDDTFSPGNAENLNRGIAEDGPILWPDPGGFDNDIIVQHIGDDPERGWLAFEARPEGTERPCTLGWRAESGDFQVGWDSRASELDDACSGEVFPADGEGLDQYEIYVEEDFDVIVDFRDLEEDGEAEDS